MTHRIARPDTAFSGSIKAKPKKDEGYLNFVRSLPCVITGRPGAEAAHVSFANMRAGATGRGKGQRASDRFALPLHPDQHRLLPDAQHNMGERKFWADHGIDPHYLALALFGAYHENNDDLARAVLVAHRASLGERHD